MGERISVLVVEDETLIRFNVVDELEDAGYQVFEAANADDAIAILVSTPSIRLVFTDIDMPGSMDGLKLAAAVRDRWPPVKIIVTSGHRIVEITDMPDGSVFFSKPYANLAVLQSMRELLSAQPMPSLSNQG
jgi:DNA-binding NtrC family response regulator